MQEATARTMNVQNPISQEPEHKSTKSRNILRPLLLLAFLFLCVFVADLHSSCLFESSKRNMTKADIRNISFAQHYGSHAGRLRWLRMTTAADTPDRHFPEHRRTKLVPTHQDSIDNALHAHHHGHHDHTFCGTLDQDPIEIEEMGIAYKIWKEHPDNQNRNLAEKSYIIPTYFHVLKATDQEGDLAIDALRRFMDTLNYGFRDTAFRFELYGFNSIVNPTWHRCQDEASFKNALRIDAPDVLNVYICDTRSYQNGGWSYYPFTVRSSTRKHLDGIVMMNPGIGSLDTKLVYYSLVHETGHWLGLAHTWTGGCSTETVVHWAGDDSYIFSGDGVIDTPAHAGPSFADTAGFSSSCWRSRPLDTCPGLPGNDPTDNYMNYVPGHCFESYGRFTPGQVERMLSQYEMFRYRNVVYGPSTYVIPTALCKSRNDKCSTSGECCGNNVCRAGFCSKKVRRCKTKACARRRSNKKKAQKRSMK